MKHPNIRAKNRRLKTKSQRPASITKKLIENKFELFKEVIETSQNEKRGLTFFIGGQTIAGVVTKILGTEAVEVRSQMFSKAIILIDAIDGVALG